jgi:hypothetical protein
MARPVRFVLLLTVALAMASPAAAAQDGRQAPLVNQDAQTMAEFEARVTKYVDLHKKLEATLPALPRSATPEEITTHQASLERLLARSRTGAKSGDLFFARARALFRRRIATLLAGPAGANIRASIDDENPGPIRLLINGRYPDTAPISSVPPEVLQLLPRLPEELEYHFIGRRLVLLDIHSHTVVDYMENALRR